MQNHTAFGASSPCYPVLGVGFVGKRNQPLYVHSFESNEEADLELNLTVHSMLDIIEERTLNPNMPTSTSTAGDDFYLGFLSLFGRFCTFGLMGPTLVKVFLVLDAEFEPTPKDEDVKRLLQQLHRAYLDYLCNPFVTINPENEQVKPALHDSPRFNKRIASICLEYHRRLSSTADKA